MNVTAKIKSRSPDRWHVSVLPSWWSPKRKLGYRFGPDIISGIAVILEGVGCLVAASQSGRAIVGLSGLWMVGFGYNLLQVGRDLGEARSTWAYVFAVFPLLLVWWATLPFVLLRDGVRLVVGRVTTEVENSAFWNSKLVVAANRSLTATVKGTVYMGAKVVKITGLSLLAVIKAVLVTVLVVVALGITAWAIRSGIGVLAGAPAWAIVIIVLLLLR